MPADYYRVYLANATTRVATGTTSSTANETIRDIYGNQLDGEFLGYQNAAGKYVDQLNTGVIRGSGAFDSPDLSGDGIQGGAFVTGFVVVPNGNVIYARPDAIYNPQLPGTYPDGTAAKPYPVLAAEATATTLNNGDLNSVVNSGVNFNTAYDRSGLGTFQPSAFFAAQEKARLTQAPVVIVAEAALSTRDPLTGVVTQRPFVLQAPSGSNPVTNDGSAAVPAMTTLIFAQGSTLKMENAALLVQNQGSALQIEGGANPGQLVNITSYKDSSIGGATNGDPSTTPQAGDYGGILFRNYNQAANNGARNTLFPGQLSLTGNPAVDNRLKGPFANTSSRTSQTDAVSGADPVMSFVNFLVEKYAGGSVPQTVGIPYDGITIENSRPTVVNSTVAFSGAGAAEAGLSEDVNSLVQDDVASGPLVRNDTFVNDGINGIYIRSRTTDGLAEATNATNVGTRGTGIGTAKTFVMDAFYPYVLTTSLVIGLDSLVNSQGATQDTADRLYMNPGTILKFSSGSGMEILPSASLNVGDQTYIKEFDALNTFGPSTAGFKANSAGLAKVVFTSYYDDNASTSYTDPITGAVNVVTPALPVVSSGSGANLVNGLNTPATSRWSGLTIDSGAVAVVNSAMFEYGGGALNTLDGTDAGINSYDFHHALELSGGGLESDEHFNNGANDGFFFFNENGEGSHTSITNNVFMYNQDVGMNVDPQALLAADPSRPLESGAPFIHGNIFQNNTLNGVGVSAGTQGAQLTSGNIINEPGTHESNLNVNSTWTGGDFTYILRDTIVLGPDFFVAAEPTLTGGFVGGSEPLPSATGLTTTPNPIVTLTLQSTLPGTVLADGTVVPGPGVPLIVKTLNNGNSPVPAYVSGANPGANETASWSGGAGFIVGIDDGTDPPTPVEELVDDGAFSQIRILGIPANQSTGQVRVPVIITSAHDSSIGTTVGSVVMNQVIPGDTILAKAGDGGLIGFGGNSLTSYDLQDPRSGSIIDNADIKYMTEIEQQGGGIAYVDDLNGDMSFSNQNDDPWDTKAGIPVLTGGTSTTIGNVTNYNTQFNAPKALTISNSNLSSFSDAGFTANPGFQLIAIAQNFGSTTTPQYTLARVSGTNGEPTHTYFVNDTISNMPVGIEIISQTGNDSPNNGVASSPTMAVILNTTFYKDGVGVNAIAQAFNGLNPYSEDDFLVMDSIFSNNTTAVNATGDQEDSDLQYNLFYQNGTNLVDTTAEFFNGNFNNQPLSGDPAFRDPANGNFNLTANSAAIDRARYSEGPSIFGNMLTPSVTLTKTSIATSGSGNQTTVFDDTNFLPIRNLVGDLANQGGTGFFFGGPNINTGLNGFDIVTLPGQAVSTRQFPDEWIPTLQTATTGTPVSADSTTVQAIATTASTPGTVGNGYSQGNYAYVPTTGQRDQLGNLRVKDPNSTNVGSGSNPFFDLGAYEYIIQNPPLVENVSAVAASNGASSNLYVPGGVAGINAYPSQLRVGISERLNPATLTPASVLLIGSGGDGVFGNANDITYNLANRLSFDNTTDSVVINTAGLLPTGTGLNDEYELVLKGTGSAIIRDNNGLALDGYTNERHLAATVGLGRLPGKRLLGVVHDRHQSAVAGDWVVHLAAGTYKTAVATAGAANVGSYLVDTTNPTFVGKVTDIFPPANPLQGDQVFVDISTTGDPNNFNILGAATGTTDANGNFSVTVTQALPNSNWMVGADGKQGTLDDTGTSLARVRIVDQAGNVSLLPTAPIASYVAPGATLGFQIDTVPPRVTSLLPTSTGLTAPNANGQVIVTATFSKNIDPSTLNANSILVSRTGGTGTFTGTGVAVPIVAGSFNITYLGGGKGPIQVTFALQGPLPNDFYRITLKGTGTNPIRDVAGNALDGLGPALPGAATIPTPRSRSSRRRTRASSTSQYDHRPCRHRDPGQPSTTLHHDCRGDRQPLKRATSCWSCRERIASTSRLRRRFAFSRPTRRAPTRTICRATRSARSSTATPRRRLRPTTSPVAVRSCSPRTLPLSPGSQPRSRGSRSWPR